MRTGKDYLDVLADGRRVYVDGGAVEDVATHPAFRGAVRSVAGLYDVAADARPVLSAWWANTVGRHDPLVRAPLLVWD